MKNQSSNLGVWGWMGVIVIGGIFLFKWLPDMLWRPAVPEIKINEHFFEAKPDWTMNGLVIRRNTLPKVHIRISPDTADEQRAKLVVTINGAEVENNCGNENYFCHEMKNVAADTEYEIVARNSAGEDRIKLKVMVVPSNSNKGGGVSSDSGAGDSGSGSTNASGGAGHANDSSNAGSASAGETTASGASSSGNTSNGGGSGRGTSCYHFSNGKCWDDMESEAYSMGLYDHMYGDYGTSLYYEDDCDRECQDLLEDAYDEGWYDAH
ncbi:hypothetical protein IKE72_00990 [Candidatus Saccharibacteria bacterium]|nr:hypothetical protein [Candidatus Saccharibacteria bacterium]